MINKVICDDCSEEIPFAESCTSAPYLTGRTEIRWQSKPFGIEKGGTCGAKERCGSCGVMKGGYHHPGCEVEECPKCGDKIVSCDCFSL